MFIRAFSHAEKTAVGILVIGQFSKNVRHRSAFELPTKKALF